MIEPFEDKLRRENAPALLVRSFERSYRQLLSDDPGTISARGFQPFDSIPSLHDLAQYEEAGRAAIPRLVIVKLNGGLGTSMGLDRAKSLIEVREGLSFLDIIARQALHLNDAYDAHIPLVFMNSYNTRADTLATLESYDGLKSDIPLDFLQHRIPKVDAATLQPVDWQENPELEWCPPGHGDIYLALQTSGLIEAFLLSGKEYAFVSNSDNLGAALDPGILGYLSVGNVPFIMEVTDRMPADRKGGHLARLKDGTLMLRELSQCPPDELDEFKDIERFRYFNTNNLWIHLPSLRKLLETHGGVLPLPVIRNRKPVDPTDPSTPAVYQLETAMGSAIALFESARALHVPRTRFAPVKTSDDLLALWSDAYELTEDFHLRLHPQRNGKPVHVSLEGRHYGFLSQLRERFPLGAPSLRECVSLRIDGDVRFGKSIVCTGEVNIDGSGVIRDGAILSGTIHIGES